MEERREVELPPLPEPNRHRCASPIKAVMDYYSADQMRAYGAECARMAREQEREVLDKLLARAQRWDFPVRMLIEQTVRDLREGK